MRTYKKIVYTLIFVFSLLCLGGTIYINNIKPFTSIKLSIKDTISIDKFFDRMLGNAIFITDINDIDTTKLGSYDVEIKVNGKTFKSKLEIVDEEAPVVNLKDLKLSYYADVSADMFIDEVEDDTSYTISFANDIEKKVGKQQVVIDVVDEAGNMTQKEATLELVKVKDSITLEAGTKFELDSVLYGAEFVKDKKIVKNIDTKTLKEQELVIIVDGDEYTIKVNVQDTTAPIVKTNNVTIWWDQKVSSSSRFIKKITDATKTKTEYLTNIDYQKIGTQTVKLRVTDTAGNKTDVTTKLTIKKDTIAPRITTSTISVVRGNKINYKSGVSAYDDHDGKVSFTYDSSKVDLNKVGTYTVTYTAKDSSGNKATAKRTIKITGNSEDVKDKLRPIVKSLKAGTNAQTALNIRNWVASNISYKAGNIRSLYPAAWEGITTRKGDCYVHYALSKVMLDLAGIPNKSIHLGTFHYWNLVQKDNGSWCHLDSTPGFKVDKLVDDETYAKKFKRERGTWDKNAYPKADCK